MRRHLRQALTGMGAGWLLACVVGSTVVLLWLAYSAINEWRRSAALLAQRRADAAVELLAVGIARDMRRVQSSVLASLQLDESGSNLQLDPYAVGSAFARYPYPEAFFSGFGDRAVSSMTFYTRGDRSPAWLPPGDVRQGRFPVTVGTVPDVSTVLLSRIAADVTHGRRVATFDIELNGADYQVVALLSYADPTGNQVKAIVGFLVNVEWVKQNYFRDLVTQMVRIQGGDAGLSLVVHDANGTSVAGDVQDRAEAPSSTRQFQMLFFDPLIVALDPPPDLRREWLTARATVFSEPTLVAAEVGARRTLGIATVSALFLTFALGLSVRAARHNTQLTAMRSDFVSAVTHELKTPIATMRAISETLASGRLADWQSQREYAQLSVNEAKRLTRIIDNLLAYARITDVTEIYSFEPLALSTVAQQCVKDFQPQLSTQQFAVNVHLPDDVPLVRGDRQSLVLAVSNLLDNAIRYSDRVRQLSVMVFAAGPLVILEVTDSGCGIPKDEIPQVTRRFFRGRGALSGGSGLGLSIAQRIVADHAGSLLIRSAVGVGTTVSIELPALRIEDEEADIDS